jgi:ActR/RegA family two-component response regulator
MNEMNRRAKKRLLLAENSPEFLRSLGSLLELKDYEVVHAVTLEDAMEQLQSDPIDLALVDLRLTDDTDQFDVSGLAVAREAAKKGVPCVILTAFPSVETTRMALRSLGEEPPVADYLPKASGPQAILDVIALIGQYETDGE